MRCPVEHVVGLMLQAWGQVGLGYVMEITKAWQSTRKIYNISSWIHLGPVRTTMDPLHRRFFFFRIQLRHFALIQMLIKWSQQNFAHATTAQLSWHMQKFVVMEWPGMSLLQHEISIDFLPLSEIWWWNGSLCWENYWWFWIMFSSKWQWDLVS